MLEYPYLKICILFLPFNWCLVGIEIWLRKHFPSDFESIAYLLLVFCIGLEIPDATVILDLSMSPIFFCPKVLRTSFCFQWSEILHYYALEWTYHHPWCYTLSILENHIFHSWEISLNYSIGDIFLNFICSLFLDAGHIEMVL